jgi:hypothetical protein
MAASRIPHTEYVQQILSLKREVSTLLTLFPRSVDALMALDRELDSLMYIVPTPSIMRTDVLCTCLTHTQYCDRILSIDQRMRVLVNYLYRSVGARTYDMRPAYTLPSLSTAAPTTSGAAAPTRPTVVSPSPTAHTPSSIQPPVASVLPRESSYQRMKDELLARAIKEAEEWDNGHDDY